MPGSCKSCGADHAAFGFRRRGFPKDLPARLRTMIWVCGAPDCQARAQDWKAKADGEAPRTLKPKSNPTAPPDPAQGSLF